MKKRILSVLLCLCMMITLLPTTARAEENPEEAPIQETLTAPEIGARPYDEETSSDMVLSVPGEWDSYAWEAYFGGDWMPCGEDAEMLLDKETYVQYGFRCTVTKDGQSVTTPAYAYDPAVWESSGLMLISGSDSLSGSSSYIKFYQNSRNRFDIQGIDGNNEFKTTFNNGGYRTAVSVEGGSKVDVAYTGEPVTVGPSLTAQTALSIEYGGRYVQITYTVTNNGSTTKTFKIGSSADVMIHNNDKAEVKGSTTGLTMSGSPKNSYTFNLVAPTCDTLWYGFWTQAYDNMFTNMDVHSAAPYNKDSGMAWSWSGSVAPGETWTRYVLIGAGELPEPPKAPSIPDLTTRTVKAGATETFTGTGEAGTTVHITVAGQETSAEVGDDGTFTADIPIPANYPDPTAAVTYWATNAEGGISDMQKATVNVLRKPQITLTTSTTTVMEEDTLDENWYKGFIKSSVGDVTYTSETINTATPGTYTVTYTAAADDFPSATATLTVTVLPKPAALTGTTVSENTPFTLSATMTYTGGQDYTETGFVYGALQNPTLTLNDGTVKTSGAVNAKNGTLTATVEASKLTAGITYYARAYAKTSDGTVIYGEQSSNFGLGVPSYGTFSVKNNNDNTFTITRDKSDGAQTVYYRTVNGSAVGGTHFTHAAGTLTFAAGVTEQTVEVTELGVTNAYNSNAATAYSNADRTYSLEIYRVEGGATIGTSTATRTMTNNSDNTVDRTIYTTEKAESHNVGGGDSYDNRWVADHSGAGDGNLYWRNDRNYNATYEYDNFNTSSSIDGRYSGLDYIKATAQAYLYRYDMLAHETEDGWEHAWMGTHEPNNAHSYTKCGSTYTGAPISLDDSVAGHAVWTAVFQIAEGYSVTKYFPTMTGGGGEDKGSLSNTVTGYNNDDSVVSVGGTTYAKIPIADTVYNFFAATGANTDKWYVESFTDYTKIYDTVEPQLLSIAPMAGGTYLPGDKVTVALVFDEIVDSQNSNLSSSSYITTSWGTFTYAGGADTNVLYFTGTVPENASGNISLTTLNCASQIKDMCDTAGTASSGSGSTTVTVGTNPKPTVTVTDINNNNGTLTATITATNAGKLEYVWSTESTAPAYGWQLINTGSTATTRQTSGAWYLHARATNDDGWVVYGCKSYTFSGSTPVTLPDLTLFVDNTAWAQTRDITLTKTPDNASVTVSGPDVTGATVSGTTYTATSNGVYTFTLTSGDQTVVQQIAVSKLDNTAPTVTVNSLPNTTYTEAVTLTVTAADTESGLASTPLTGIWSNGSTSQTATFTGSGGTWTTTSPDQSGTWTLSVTATDAVGNTASATSAAYTINADRPTITVNQTSSSNTGVTYSYSVTGNSDITVQLPDGTTTTAHSGEFTITEPGTYTISVTDAAGHFVSETITVTAPSGGLDGVKPDVRLYTASDIWTNQDVTVDVSVYEAGGLSTVTWSKDGGTAQSLTPTVVSGETGSYTASFLAIQNGTYTVTAEDAAHNVGTENVVIDFIDKDKPTMTAKIGTDAIDGSKWYSAAQTVTLTAADTASGVESVEYAVTQTETAPDSLKPLPDSKEVTVSGDGTHYIYYKVTDKAGNVLTGWTGAIRIDSVTPTLSITGGDAGADSLTLTPVISGTEATVTVSKDGGDSKPVTGGSYTIASEGTYTFTATSNAGLTDTKTVTVYAVTFNSAGGSIVAKQLVVSGGKATQPTAPTKAGYTFDGWQRGGTAFDFVRTAITDDTALTAVWTLDDPEVTLTADKTTATYNGGSTVITLTANVSHDASDLIYTYEWYKGGTKLEGQTASTLKLKTVADSGSYTVKVTASGDGLTSSPKESHAVSVSITKATPSITTAPTASDITYGQSLSASDLSGGAASTGGTFTWSAGEIKPFVSDSNTTEYSVIFTPTDAANYTTETTTVTLTVKRKELTPSVTAAEGKIYDGNTSTTGTLSLSGAVFNEQPTATGTFTFVDKNVGTNKAVKVTGITLSGAWGDNYRLSTTTLSDVATSAAITPAEVGLTWSGHENLTYTGYPVSVTATATGLVSGDTCDVTVSNGDKTNAGTYTATATGLSNSNYRLPTAVTQGYTIAKAPVSFTVSDNDLSYNSTDRTATVAQVAGQTPAIGSQFTVSYKQEGSEVTPKNAGTYEVWVRLNSDNFEFAGQEDTTRTMKVGTLTISTSAYPQQENITWPTAAEVTYGQPLSASSLTGGGSGGTFAWKEPTTIPTVSNSGYTVVFTPTDTSYNPVEKTILITVNPKELTVIDASAANRDYIPNNTAVDVSGGTLKGVVTRNGVVDTVALDASNASGTVGTADAGQNKPVTVTGYTLTETDAGNYTLKQPTDVKVTITPAEGGGSVTMAGWIYDGTAKNSPVPTSDKNGSANVTYRYTGRNGTSYDSAACPTDAGDYTVTATFAATNNYTQATTTAEFTIEKKTVLAVWTNLTQVYDGTAKVLTISLAGLVQGDNCTATASAEPNAGTYPIELSLSGDAAGNYTASNPTATLTIQKAPVTFVVTNNAAQYDGNAHTATVTAAPAVAHTVTYRQNGQTIAAPTEAGTYEVWAEITNPNYRHADAADGGARKIGVLTIYRQEAPATYTATFAGGEGATGTAPTPQSGLLAGSVIVLPNAGGLMKTDHAFAGWKLGNVVYQSGETYTMSAGNVTFTAQWKTNVYTISGVVDQNNLPLDHVTVTLMLGGQQIAETVTDSSGQYTFSGVIPGIYNLVASRDGVTMTVKVEIIDQDTTADAIHLPVGKTNSVVEVKPGAATAVIGNLETVFTDDTVYKPEDKTVVQSGGSVEIKLTVDKTELTDEQTQDMQNKAGGYTLGQELALTVEKTVTESGGMPTTTNIPDTGVLLETLLLLPAELQGKDSYTVLRLHGGAVHTLTTSPNADGEFFEVSADKTTITIHARYYSEYVIAWRQYSYGGGGTTTYPIALPDSTPDGGTVSVTPKSASKGSTVTITVDPDDGYELDQLTVTDKDGNKLPVTAKGDGKYAFEMPSGSVTIEVTFKESVWNRNYGDCPGDHTCPIWPYTDADAGAWYHDGVHFCLENGLMVGCGDGSFKPDASTTRAMLAVMLWRLNGSPTVNYALDFEDVKEGAWYTEAVRWAKSEGVAGGYGNGKFGPSDTLTREQMVTMLYRYAQYKGFDVSVGEDTNILSYGDAEKVAEFAIPAMQWACGSGIVSGKDAADGSGLILDPKGSTTRAQMATMVMRFFTENVK